MADLRYLRKRGNVYWTRIKVPANLRRKAGREHLERSLRTGDLPIRPIVMGTLSYLRPGFHPRQDKNLHLAEAFFARS